MTKQSRQASDKLRELFEFGGITRVFYVDDIFTVSNEDIADSVVDFKSAERRKHFPGIDFTQDLEDWREEVFESLNSMADQRIECLRMLVRKRSNNTDHAKARQLDCLLKPLSITPTCYSLSEWKSAKATLLAESVFDRALVLFDLDMSKDGGTDLEGITQLVALKNDVSSDSVTLALLSHVFKPEDEYERWKEFGDTEGISRDDFILISKDRLSTDASVSGHQSVAESIGRGLINRHCKPLKERAMKLVTESQGEANNQLQSLDLYDFQQVVLSSSLGEGAWELDTLFRLYALYNQDEFGNRFREDAELAKLTREVRKLFGIVGHWAKGKTTSEVRRLERLKHYENEANRNKLLRPVQLGDLFRYEKGDSQRDYILLAQPCDLTLRKNGSRKADSAFLVQIDSCNEPTGNVSFGRLPNFRDTGETGYVRFSKAGAVSLSILDLVWLNHTGRASISTEFQLPEFSTDGLTKRAEILRNEASQFMKFQRALNSSEVVSQLEKELGNESLVTLMKMVGRPESNLPEFRERSVDIKAESIDYYFRRTGQVREPLASEILREFSAHQSRGALEHDMTREH